MPVRSITSSFGRPLCVDISLNSSFSRSVLIILRVEFKPFKSVTPTVTNLFVVVGLMTALVEGEAIGKRPLDGEAILCPP
jgi:hypothetical protein